MYLCILPFQGEFQTCVGFTIHLQVLDTYLPFLDDVGVAYTRETHSLMKCIKDTFIGAKNL
jgi:hypothetical protein